MLLTMSGICINYDFTLNVRTANCLSTSPPSSNKLKRHKRTALPKGVDKRRKKSFNGKGNGNRRVEINPRYIDQQLNRPSEPTEPSAVEPQPFNDMMFGFDLNTFGSNDMIASTLVK